MNHVFSAIPKANIPRSVFRRNHNLKTTINTDYLYPIYVDEALPGDTFVFKSKLFARLSTPLTPIMDELYLDTFFFAIPVRLVDKDFKKLMGERPFGDVRNDYTVPQLAAGLSGVASGSLSDYLGIPINTALLKFCPWWHRAYNLVYNEYFRDENLCPARPVAGVHEDGSITTESLADYVLCRRCKRKDYFTSCLPWPQKGDPVTFPLSGITDVLGKGAQNPPIFQLQNADGNYHLTNQTQIGTSSTYIGASLGVTEVPQETVPAHVGSLYYGYRSNATGLMVDLSEATAVTVNQLREAFAIQRLLETDARGGTRYIELVRAHFNVISPDARQQRPEYLGGSSEPLNVCTVAQTSASTDDSPQGNLAAFVTGRNSANFIKSFTEHTLLLGLVNVRADLSYQQGLPRMFSRRTKYDFYWPELANLGEQAVLNREIYARSETAKDEDGNVINDLPFGFQERWAEYKYHPNYITGQFRSTAALTLDYWHLAQKFDELPTLNQTFIEEHVPIDRVLAVSTAQAPNLILDGWFAVKCARPMPLYSVPGLTRL